MDTITAIHTRRSIRDYETRAVERAVIEEILWDAAQAPTTPVSGPFRFHVIAGLERVAALGDIARRSIESFALLAHPLHEQDAAVLPAAELPGFLQAHRE